MSGINQKEYLKKYLGIGKSSGEKKKKKKTKKIGNGLKIVDDDIEVSLNEEIQADLTADNDEAPQIVSVIDDRPPSLRIDEETRTNLWKPIGSSDVSSEFEKKLKFEGNIKLSKTMGIKHDSLKKKTGKSDINKIVSSDKQRSIKQIKEDVSLQSIKIKQENISSDQDFSPVRQHRKSEDFSPPRRGRKQAYSDSNNSSPQRNRVKDSDNSPSRSGKKKDISPPRKIQKKQDSDISPPRKNKSPSRSGKGNDISPPRKNQTQVHKDLSPPRKGRSAKEVSSPSRKITKGEDDSPPRKRRESSPPRKKSRWGDNDEGGEKMEKTLDGKTAGLQNAADLVKETLEFKKREDELFKKLSSEVSGANATTVVRRKKKDEDLEEEDRKRKAEEENKEKYNKWGKGLKQVEDVNEKIKSDLYEMSKPLARYADDDDLEKYLKDQEREGDPMLAYIRQKKRKKAVVEGATVIQQYEGDAPPNRFGIRPGYRWDGVDRSNGYEKKWFEVQNSRKANIEESYKWSTEDM